jgi:hypothetical protein
LRHNTLGHCFVKDADLDVIWPEPAERENQAYHFANRYGIRLAFYQKGLGAIFVDGVKKGRGVPRDDATPRRNHSI